MTDVTELEQRIVAAMDRIAYSADQMASAPSAADGQLAEELEVERATNARLAEAGTANLARIERLETRLARLTDRLDAVDDENARLITEINALRATNTQLRDGADADVINASLKAENDSLKAERAAQIAEMDEILGEIAPLVKEA
ncbi:hypothetical protein C8N43_0867 [Litoreibacter ponti]|uniref:Uncharacterized protein n=1 Tax=Litoreibacter ponti TaxID=1510457 RepID=A0A2T6BJI6_9RHOB|nr:hypothetical protein [Litoreibacter ponti]PTX56214.1 hypothetical protein C8N43_0867 [Litoreibacter ponti]